MGCNEVKADNSPMFSDVTPQAGYNLELCAASVVLENGVSDSLGDEMHCAEDGRLQWSCWLIFGGELTRRHDLASWGEFRVPGTRPTSEDQQTVKVDSNEDRSGGPPLVSVV